MPRIDRSAATGFAVNPLDRLSERREDADFLAGCRREASTRFIVLAGDEPVLRPAGPLHGALFDAAEADGLGAPVRELFLGVDAAGAAVFARTVEPAVPAARGDVAVVDLRSIAMRGLVDPAVLGELGTAKAMLDWHRRHGFCANCGAPSCLAAGGWRRECDACGTQHFPRTDPVVIMLALEGDRCLLGRQARFPQGMYSALAGFLEPGETIEDAVRREIREEAGIACGEVAYHASQPWPFPSSLMIGCFARALEERIIVDTAELEDARWFDRDEVAAMAAGTHPDGLSVPLPFAIAHHLVKAWLDEGEAVLGG